MSAGGERRPVEAAACPWFGLADDPGSRFAFVAAEHRCYAGSRARPVDLGHQAGFCLGEAYPTCPRYRPWGPGTETSPGVPTLPVVPARAADRPRRTAIAVIALLLVAIVAIVAGAAILARGGIGAVPGGSSPAAGIGATVAPSPTATPTPGPTPSPTATPTPAPTATPEPTATVRPTPTPAPTPRIHVVARGDTLTAIAARYGVSLKALERANGIKNPSLIRVGQRLVIPLP